MPVALGFLRHGSSTVEWAELYAAVPDGLVDVLEPTQGPKVVFPVVIGRRLVAQTPPHRMRDILERFVERVPKQVVRLTGDCAHARSPRGARIPVTRDRLGWARHASDTTTPILEKCFGVPGRRIVAGFARLLDSTSSDRTTARNENVVSEDRSRWLNRYRRTY